MTLRSRNDISHRLMDSTFASRDLAKPLPKYNFPDEEHNARDVLQLVDDELLLSPSPPHNPASYRQTCV